MDWQQGSNLVHSSSVRIWVLIYIYIWLKKKTSYWLENTYLNSRLPDKALNSMKSWGDFSSYYCLMERWIIHGLYLHDIQLIRHRTPHMMCQWSILLHNMIRDTIIKAIRSLQLLILINFGSTGDFECLYLLHKRSDLNFSNYGTVQAMETTRTCRNWSSTHFKWDSSTTWSSKKGFQETPILFSSFFSETLITHGLNKSFISIVDTVIYELTWLPLFYHMIEASS